MRSCKAIWCVVLVVLAIAVVPAAWAEEKWVPLFNGKDLEGWTPKIKDHPVGENFANTFRVQDGLLQVRYDGYTDGFKEQYGHLFYNESFGNHYRIRVEYRFVGEQVAGGPGWATRNSGIMLHCQDPKTMRVEQEFPVSVEVQLLGGLGKGARTTCNMCSPGTHVVIGGVLTKMHCVNSKSKTFEGEDWVTAEVEVNGNTITHFINGEQVMQYTDPQLDDRDKDAKKILDATGTPVLTGGFISLQSESHPCDFRKVEILKLEAK